MESTKGELTGERPLLLELQMISRELESKRVAKAGTRLFQGAKAASRLEKITLLARRLMQIWY
jgi:hypothetical protein